MRIAVIISTYNGNGFLKMQLDSILAQEDVDKYIFIRDDGSTDKTKEFLEEYCRNYSNITVEYGDNIGYAKSFFTMLFKAEGYDYYAFSDQDDFWKPRKLITACTMIGDTVTPTVYYSNLQICDENLNPRFITQLEKRKKTLESVVTRRSIAGCTMVFNKAFFEVLTQGKNADVVVNSHDNYIISLCYALNGNVICDRKHFIDYRQHSGNSSGTTHGIANRVKKEKKEIEKIKTGQSGEARLAKSLLDNYSDKITQENKIKLKKICELYRFGISRLTLFFSPAYTTGNLVLTIVGKIKILLGWI